MDEARERSDLDATTGIDTVKESSKVKKKKKKVKKKLERPGSPDLSETQI